MLAVSPGLCAAQATPQAVEVPNHDVSHKQPNPDSNSAAGSSSGEDSAAENELLEAANQIRERVGVPPLRMDKSLREAARVHAQLMIANGRLNHQFSGEPQLLERIAQVSPLPLNDALKSDALKIDRAGENVAYAPCAPDVNDALMRSAPHRLNLLDRGFNVAGIAAIWSNGKLYVVQDFAHQIPSYSAEQSGKLVSRAIGEIRQQAGLSKLVQVTPPNLDEAACSLAKESRPNAHLLATAYDNRRMITYTESHPGVLPQAAVSMLRDPSVRQFAVGACYARNAAYPTGTYWVAILLY
ncbi:MAG TPA: CAP domain-containing protein [Terriglobales bacterium]|nr:CAP domain-containing protein [Terriglobales bacterium]